MVSFPSDRVVEAISRADAPALIEDEKIRAGGRAGAAAPMESRDMMVALRAPGGDEDLARACAHRSVERCRGALLAIGGNEHGIRPPQLADAVAAGFAVALVPASEIAIGE